MKFFYPGEREDAQLSYGEDENIKIGVGRPSKIDLIDFSAFFLPIYWPKKVRRLSLLENLLVQVFFACLDTYVH